MMALNAKSKCAHYYVKSRSQQTSLLIAAKTGNTSKVRHLLEVAEVNVDTRDKHGNTPLMLAVEGMHVDTVSTIFEFRPNIYLRNQVYQSALGMALKIGLSSKKIVRMFLNVVKNECRDDVRNLASTLTRFDCPLYLAVLLENPELLRTMLQNGCPVNTKDPQTLETALHVAVALKNLDCAKLLVEHNADVNARDSNGRIPLAGYQSRFDHEDELELLRLLAVRCTTLTTRNNDGLMQVWSALRFSQKGALKILLRCDIDWCVTDMFGLSPLHYLACNEAVLANQEILDDLRGRAIYDAARERASTRVLPFVSSRCVTRLVEMLLDAGVDPDIRDSNGCTALFKTARFNGDVDLVEESRRTFVLLLRRGANVQVPSNAKQTVFDNIVEFKSFHLVGAAIGQLLIDESFGTPIVEEVWRKINSEEVFQEQLRLCKREMEELKCITIHHSVTLFDVLTASEKTLAVYARNESFSSKMEALELYSTNSYFNCIIGEKFDKIMEIVRLRKDTADLVCECTGICYVAYPAVIDKITDYVICK